MNCKKPILAVAIVALLVLSGLPMTAEDSDAEVSEKTYGVTSGFDLDMIDEILKLLTDKTLKELVESAAKTYGYEVEFNPLLQSKFAIKRNVTETEDHMTLTDSVIGYFVLAVSLDAKGMFPASGTYMMNDGESAEDFIERVFVNGRTEEHDVSLEGAIGLTLDASLLTYINRETGEMELAYTALFPMIYAELNSNMKIAEILDDENNLLGLTISYEENSTLSNVYGDFQIMFDIEDLQVFGEGEWTEKPTITQTVTRSVVSTDLVKGIWPMIKEIIGEGGKISEAIPELILNILTSTDRKLDVFDTIKSLTGRDVPSITFTGEINVSDVTDEDGTSILFKIKRNDSTISISYPLGGYTFSLGKIIDLIPNDILPEETKGLLKIVTGILGLNSLEVVEITDDEEKIHEIDEIQKTVTETNMKNEEYETDIPVIYIVITIAVILAACIVTALMWRGKI